MRRLLLFPERCPPSLVEPAHLDVNQHLPRCEASLIIPQHFVVVLHTRTRSKNLLNAGFSFIADPLPSFPPRTTFNPNFICLRFHAPPNVPRSGRDEAPAAAAAAAAAEEHVLSKCKESTTPKPQPSALSSPNPQRNRLSTTHKSSWFLFLFRSSSPLTKRVMLVLVKRLTLVVGGGASAPRSRKEEGGAWR